MIAVTCWRTSLPRTAGTMVLDRRSLSYAAIGLSPSWMLLDLEVRPAAADSNVSSIGIYILFIYFMSHPDG